MKVEFVEEKEDGSGVFTFDFTEDEKNALLRYGIVSILEKAVEENKYYAQDGVYYASPAETEESSDES